MGKGRITVWITLSVLAIFLISIIATTTTATTSISDVSPSDGSIHVEIKNNPPDPDGYVNLSFTVTDNSGGGDMEIYLDVNIPEAWWKIEVDNTEGGSISNFSINISENKFFWLTGELQDMRVFETDQTTSIPYNVTAYDGTNNYCNITLNDTISADSNHSFYLYTNRSYTTDGSTDIADATFVAHSITEEMLSKSDFWVNRWHGTDLSSPYSTFHHEDEYPYNHTNRQCDFRLLTKDYSDGSWNNQTYSFRTDARPSPPSNPTPSDGSLLSSGEQTLSVEVNHPDATAGAKVYNVSFYQWPSGRLIGYNHTNTGWTNGTIVTCNSTYLAKYDGTQYFWYAKSKDDEYWSDNSSVWSFNTTYPDSEPSTSYFYDGGQIYVEPDYTDTEPSTSYYYDGGQISVYYTPVFGDEIPTNGTYNEWINTHLGHYFYKEGEVREWQVNFYANDTTDETGSMSDDLSSGTFDNTTGDGSVELNGSVSSGADVANGISWYNMETNSGSTLYDQWDANDGSFDGDPQWVSSKGTNGTGSYALNFDGNDEIDIPDSDNLDITSEITISAWVNPDSFNEHGTVATKNGAYYFQIDSNGKIAVYTYWNDGGSKGNSEYTYSDSALSTGVWQHIVFVEESDGTRNIYIDGELDKTASMESSIWSSDDPLNIGGQTDRRYFDGTIDEVAVFDYALSSAEVKEVYDEGLGVYTYVDDGYRISPTYNYPDKSYSSTLTYSETEPTGTSLDMYYNLSKDGGSTWTGWTLFSSGKEISVNGDSQIQFKNELSTTDTSKTPSLDSMTISYRQKGLFDQVGSTQTVILGDYANNETINDDFSQGTFDNTSGDGDLILDGYSTGADVTEGVSRYNMETNTGSTIYDQWNGYDGSINGATWTSSKGGNGTGAYALDFDGGNDYVNFGDISELSTPQKFSISLWFKRDSDQNDATNHAVENVLLAKSSYNDNDNIEIGTDGSSVDVYLDTTDRDEDASSYDAGISNGNWYHLVLTYDETETGGETKLYIDGTLVKTWAQWGGNIDSTTSEVSLGVARPNDDKWGDFDGQMDEVVIFNYDLTETEVKDIYDNGIGTWHYYSTGERISPTYSFSGVAYDSPVVNINQTTPTDTTLDVYYNISTDGGNTWSGRQGINDGDTISEISRNSTLDNVNIIFYQKFSTSDDAKTPTLYEINVTVNRWTLFKMPYSNLDWETTYWWYTEATNASYGTYQSDIYHFTTLNNSTEPTTSYFYDGAQIYTEPDYTDTEPETTYYYEGGQINVIEFAHISNPVPSNQSTDIPVNGQEIGAYINKSGDAVGLEVRYYFNDTTDESWYLKSTKDITVPPNQTVYMDTTFDGLQYDTTYYFYVQVYNSTTGMQTTSDIYHFTTTAYDDTEPSTTYHYDGGQIYVEPEYTDTQPTTTYYYEGGQIPLNRPLDPTDPHPPDGTSCGDTDRTFSVLVNSTNTSATIDTVKFYWSDGTLIGTDTNIPAGSRAEVSVTGLTNYTWYDWYAIAEDGEWTEDADIWDECTKADDAQSSTFSYRPGNCLPVLVESPTNNSHNIPVTRKLIGGEYQRFVPLEFNLTDPDGDDMGFKLSVDDPTQAGYQWEQRWTQLTGVNNGTYRHDETWFNKTDTTYHWKLEVYDGNPADSNTYNQTTYIFSFEAPYFVDWWWKPRYPTNEDTTHFYQITEDVERVNWTFGDGHNSTVFNNSQHNYSLAGYYNVSLTVFNDTEGRNYTMSRCPRYKTEYMRIDRNITTESADDGTAGYNYWCWHGNQTNCSEIADLLNLSSGSWIHVYNETEDTWDGYFVFGNGTGIDSNLGNWENAVIVVNYNSTSRINLTENYSYTQNKWLLEGSNLVSWSDVRDTTAANLSFLQSDEWVYKWDTMEEKWYGYLYGVGGDDFNVTGYDVLTVDANSDRLINIGRALE